MSATNYIGGTWVPAAGDATDPVVDPATGDRIAEVARNQEPAWHCVERWRLVQHERQGEEAAVERVSKALDAERVGHVMEKPDRVGGPVLADRGAEGLREACREGSGGDWGDRGR